MGTGATLSAKLVALSPSPGSLSVFRVRSAATKGLTLPVLPLSTLQAFVHVHLLLRFAKVLKSVVFVLDRPHMQASLP